MNPRGRWLRGECQRPRRSRSWGREPKSGHFDVWYLRRPLFLRCFFLILPLKSHRTDSKRTWQKKTQTDTHQTDLSRARGRLDPVSRHFKRCNRSKKPSKEGPESSSQIPLKKARNFYCDSESQNHDFGSWKFSKIPLFTISQL